MKNGISAPNIIVVTKTINMTELLTIATFSSGFLVLSFIYGIVSIRAKATDPRITPAVDTINN
jgi:hypothetical protein